MPKRFTDTDIWDQDWYVSLPNKYKLFWNYIKDKCDDCGVWRPNKEIIQRIICEPLNLNEFLMFVNTDEKIRVLVLPNGRWFLKDYFFFQYGDHFNPHSPVHRGVLKRLITHCIHISELAKVTIGKLKEIENQELRQIAYEYNKHTVAERYGYPINSTKDKEKDKAKDINNNTDTLIVTNSENEKKIENGETNKSFVDFKASGANLYAKRLNGKQTDF